MEKRSRGGGLRMTFLKLSVLPILLLTLFVTVFTAGRSARTLRREAETGLRDLNGAISAAYDMIYPGDYTAAEELDELYLFKGDHQINEDYSVIDKIKENTGADITISYQNVRVITTLMDENNNRLTGTMVSNSITKEVMGKQVGKFYQKVPIGGKNYFAYYAPLINSDGSSVGMLFVAKPSEEVEKQVWKTIAPIVAGALAVSAVMILVATVFSNKFLQTLIGIETLLEKTAGGNLTAELEPELLKREDELGDMGRNVVRMQKSIRELIELDQLTGLYNRRYVQRKLEAVQAKSLETGEPFSVAIGDIDFFKKVNDTYGHECGDAVLMDVSARMRELMKGRGFAARWGGEEFLLVFENYRLEMAADSLEDLLRLIRSRTVAFQGEKVKVTMTFGVTEGSAEQLDRIIGKADEKLYYGKNNGRNQVVWQVS